MSATSATYGQESSTVYQRQQAEKDSTSSGKVTHTDFLKLLTKQLTSQDPLNPMQDLDFTAQLAQLQALDEQMAMTKSMQAMRIDTQLQAGTNMIGKYISGTDETGASASGMVSRVVQSDGSIYVELSNKQRVDVGSVNNVWNDANSMYQELANSTQLIDKYVDAGYDSAGQPIRGIVEKIQVVNGQVMAKLYNNGLVALNQIKELRDPTADEIYTYCIPEENRKQLEAAQKMGDMVVKGKNADGKEVEGMVCKIEFDQTTFETTLVLYSGDKIKYKDLEGDAREPKSSDLASNLKNMWVDGLDEDGKDAGGIVIGATDNEEGVALLVKQADGTTIELYWDALKSIRDATDDEKKAAGISGESSEETGGSGEESSETEG